MAATGNSEAVIDIPVSFSDVRRFNKRFSTSPTDHD
jgi:hypothetical protein